MKYKHLILLTLFLTAGFANAWDGQRHGFLLGIGAGAAYDNFTGIQHDRISPEQVDNSTFGYAISPKIGYAINNRLAFYYSRYPVMFSVQDAANKDVGVTSCIEALIVHYYLTENAPSFYFGGGAGVGYFFDDGTSSNYSKEALKGIGVIGSVGYEPIKHVTTELSLHYKSPQSGASDFSVSFIISVLGY